MHLRTHATLPYPLLLTQSYPFPTATAGGTATATATATLPFSSVDEGCCFWTLLEVPGEAIGASCIVAHSSCCLIACLPGQHIIIIIIRPFVEHLPHTHQERERERHCPYTHTHTRTHTHTQRPLHSPLHPAQPSPPIPVPFTCLHSTLPAAGPHSIDVSRTASSSTACCYCQRVSQHQPSGEVSELLAESGNPASLRDTSWKSRTALPIRDRWTA